MTRPRYYSNLPPQPRSRPSDGLPAIGVIADRAFPKSIIGIAYPWTHVGGCQPADDRQADYQTPEVVWRLVLDRTWEEKRVANLEAKQTLDGRYVLRDGEFVELAESAF